MVAAAQRKQEAGHHRRRAGRCAAVLLAVALPCAWGQGIENPAPVPVQLDISSSAMPRIGGDAGAALPRIEMALLQPRQASLAPALGLTPASGPAPASVDVGLLYRHPMGGEQRIDVSAWRRIGNDDALSLIQQRQPTYGARVEMKFTPARAAGLATDVNFIGMQLESGARITVRRKDGRPMVYYRAKF
jgi:hypothetical protein